MNVPNKTKGFTIIEVVLVLAIAGLIFLVVFLALPALQRSQRDSQRKSDLGKLMSQVTAYQSNTQGNVPNGDPAWATFRTSYLAVNGTPYKDPSTGVDYVINQPTAAPNGGVPAPGNNQILVYPGMSCGSGALTGTFSAGSRTLAAVIKQEQGGFFCQGN